MIIIVYFIMLTDLVRYEWNRIIYFICLFLINISLHTGFIFGGALPAQYGRARAWPRQKPRRCAQAWVLARSRARSFIQRRAWVTPPAILHLSGVARSSAVDDLPVSSYRTYTHTNPNNTEKHRQVTVRPLSGFSTVYRCVEVYLTAGWQQCEARAGGGGIPDTFNTR